MDEFTHNRYVSEGDLVGVAFGLAGMMLLFVIGGIIVAAHYASACVA